MKTVIQQLIERLEEEDINVPFLIKSVYLEKEKEQIITAFEAGYKSCDLDEAFEINRKLASGEEYYYQTYNQNK
jgi:Cys-tRNA synthase (O-phospho-L-seryl-tRNA:Cys-tRNA synthase)